MSGTPQAWFRAPRPATLPLPASSFIGRGQELDAVARLLASARLVTLTGAGGSGKTRLALQFAATRSEHWAGAVSAVELEALSEPALVLQAVASALGVHEPESGRLLDAVIERLATGPHLLLLDNCEHVIDAAAALVRDLLRGCPALSVLATSREALRVDGEQVYGVPPLGLPDRRRTPPPARLAGYEAVRLFVERAAAASAGFELTRRNAAAVLQICRRLDGLPLAIELAAARVNALAPEQIAARLDDRFRLLTGGSRTAVPRQRTLQAMIDWSYDLLDEAERTLFDRLAIFAGGFSLEAAEAICAPPPEAGEARLRLDAADVDALLGLLVDKSLVVRVLHEGEPRFHLLESIRAYASVNLRVSGEAETLRRAHRAWFLRLAERAEPELLRPDARRWLDLLERERDNLRLALAADAGAVEGSDADLRLAAALLRFWAMRGYLSEGRTWLDAVLARSAGRVSRSRARALLGAGHLARLQGDYTAAAALLVESLSLSRHLGDDDGAAAALNNLGLLALDRDDLDSAAAHFEDALSLRRPLGDPRGIAALLHNLALVALRAGDLDRADSLFHEHIALIEPGGGRLAAVEGGLGLAGIALARGDPEDAAARYRRALDVIWEEQSLRLLPACLEGLALALLASGDAPEAVRLLAAADALREDLGATAAPHAQAERARALAAARTALTDARFRDAWEEGRALTPEEAVVRAGMPASETPAPAEPARPVLTLLPVPGSRPAGLTEREVDVLRRLSQGLTNAEIAERLVVSPRTVNAHLTNIYTKIGVSTRAAATRWALEHGLA